MTEDERAAEYAAFVAQLPPLLEPDLVTSEHAATAFVQARSAGWTVDQLVGDAAYAARKSDRPVGAIIARLRGLAEVRLVPLLRAAPAQGGEGADPGADGRAARPDQPDRGVPPAPGRGGADDGRAH